MKQKWHRPNVKRYAHSRKLNFMCCCCFSASSLIYACVSCCRWCCCFVRFYTVQYLITCFCVVCATMCYLLVHLNECVSVYAILQSFRIYFYIQRLHHWLVDLAVQFLFDSLSNIFIFFLCGKSGITKTAEEKATDTHTVHKMNKWMHKNPYFSAGIGDIHRNGQWAMWWCH